VRALAVLLLAAAPAAAQDVDCAAATSQVEMTYCATLDFEAADAGLNEAYTAAIEVARDFGGPQEDLLREAQRAWVAFRDAACSAEGSLYEGGTAQPMVGTACMARLSEARTEDLWSYVDQGSL
jgi:uncharacterized protein YecT (DUF1311 family)